ncbi:hypothetical protein [Halorarum halobium]|uniref:hypothetical protein n=1 Tax=Halorarum halobium TaxID=3075121 RepID=UPI0028AF1D5E|nr:hypothetical protein [Halobaculum sp. XH14]
MSSTTPPHVLPEEVVYTTEHDGRPLVVCGPPTALGRETSPLDESVVGGDAATTFYRGFTRTSLEGDAASWRVEEGPDLEWGVRDGWVGFTTEQSCFGGPASAEAVVPELVLVAELLALMERDPFVN